MGGFSCRRCICRYSTPARIKHAEYSTHACYHARQGLGKCDMNAYLQIREEVHVLAGAERGHDAQRAHQCGVEQHLRPALHQRCLLNRGHHIAHMVVDDVLQLDQSISPGQSWCLIHAVLQQASTNLVGCPVVPRESPLITQRIIGRVFLRVRR